LFSGKALSHSVSEWSGGERVVIAHYAKDGIHNRLGLSRPCCQLIELVVQIPRNELGLYLIVIYQKAGIKNILVEISRLPALPSLHVTGYVPD